jgi:hypothetical protein
MFRGFGGTARHGEEAYHRIGRGGGSGIGFLALVDSPLHIGLPAAYPDFPDENILDFDLIVAGNLERVGAAWGHRAQFDHPLPVFGGGRDLLVLDGHRHFFAVARRSPYRNRHFLLEYHPSGKEIMRLDFRLRAAAQGGESERKNETFT